MSQRTIGTIITGMYPLFHAGRKQQYSTMVTNQPCRQMWANTKIKSIQYSPNLYEPVKRLCTLFWAKLFFFIALYFYKFKGHNIINILLYYGLCVGYRDKELEYSCLPR